MKRNLISVNDLSREAILALFRRARDLKEDRSNPLEGKSLALVFEKPSLRTRVTFEVGMAQLGGRAVYLSPHDIRIGERESVADVARNLSRWVDGIVARTFSHETVMELAQTAAVPVINGLSDLEHPCQALTDFFTLWERDEGLALKVAYVGDGNNVCHSLLLGAGILGLELRVSTPRGYEPRREMVERARELAGESGGRVEVLVDPVRAVKGADVVYTDVWTSMGQEEELEARREKFRQYQVNSLLLSQANTGAVVMHCLPAHRGEEITDEVLDGPQSIAFDQAENRLHLQKAILATLMA